MAQTKQVLAAITAMTTDVSLRTWRVPAEPRSPTGVSRLLL